MKLKKEIIIFSLLVLLLAISAVSANENVTLDDDSSSEIEQESIYIDDAPVNKDLQDDESNISDENDNTEYADLDNVHWILNTKPISVDVWDDSYYNWRFCWACHGMFRGTHECIKNDSYCSKSGLITNITFKPIVDNQICITVNVTNNNLTELTDVKTIDWSQMNLNYVNSSFTKGEYENGTWTIGNMSSGESAYLNIIATVKGIPFGYAVTTKTSSFETDRLAVLYRNEDYLLNIDKAYDLLNYLNYSYIILSTESDENNEEESEEYYPSEDIDEIDEYCELDDIKVIIKPDHKKYKVGDIVLWTITIKNIGHKTIRNLELDISWTWYQFKTVSMHSTKGSHKDLYRAAIWGEYWLINYLKPGETVKIYLKSKILEPGDLNIISCGLLTSKYRDLDEFHLSWPWYEWDSENIIVENSTDFSDNKELDYPTDSPDEPQIDNSNNCKNTPLEPEKTVNSTNSDGLILSSIVSLFGIVGFSYIRRN